MSINVWKTNFIGLNKPPKVISAIATASENLELWPYQSGVDDPYWAGGVNPVPYRYRIAFSFDDQNHGSHLTRTPFIYNGQDIEVGDFVAGADDGKILQVISIESKDEYNLVAIVEDYLRYNVYKTGVSIFNVPGNVVFFQINELGIPMLDPLPGIVSSTFYPNVTSRFQYMNPLTNYVLKQRNNGFEKGDAICIENGNFVLSSADNIDKFIGTVVESGPGPDQFILRPANGIIDFVPGLPGNIGDYIYPNTDGSGDLTTNSASNRPIFLKLCNAEPTYTIGKNLDPVGNDGDIIEINKVQISLINGSGTYTLTDAVTAINNSTNDHKVIADIVNKATMVTSNAADLGSAYGLVAGYVPFSASINGTIVNFTTTTNGNATFNDITVANAVDMAIDINAANIANISASVTDSGELTILNNIGDTITIINITNDSNGNPWAGSNSISSIALSTMANTTEFVLRLTRPEGGPMTLRDYQGQFFTNAGVVSGQNGRYALGLYIEQGLRSSNTTMVANLAARDALHPLPGDQAYVIDAGNGEWGFYVWQGSNWIRLTNQRSDANDARSLITRFDLATISSTGLIEQSLGFASTNRTINEIAILVTDACPVGTSIEVKTGIDTLLTEYDVRLHQTGTYIVKPEYITTSFQEIKAVLSLNSLGTGDVTIIVKYS